MITRKAFTLIELLVVVAIMGLLGTISVGGYRAMQRGMEERGVMQNVNQFIRSAYQRAQIDRIPVAVYFWNDTIRTETADETLIVVGKAVAVRRSGRISAVVGSYLYDEFGDLSFMKLMLDEDEDEDESTESGSSKEGNGMYLYYLSATAEGGFKRSVVSQTTKKFTLNEPLLSTGKAVSIESYAYTIIDKGDCPWKAGDSYGFEFAEIQLPHNYIFGSSYSGSASSPIQEVQVLNFGVGIGAGTIQVSALRPGPSGDLAVKKIATSDNPQSDL